MTGDQRAAIRADVEQAMRIHGIRPGSDAATAGRALADVLASLWGQAAQPPNLGSDMEQLTTDHLCTHDVIDVQQMRGAYDFAQTAVLVRCPGCGRVYTEVLSGTWTLAQARGEERA